MKVRLICIVICISLFMICSLNGQSQVNLLREIEHEGQIHTTDKFGNIYVSLGPRLTRFNKEGLVTGEFRSVYPGNISSIDASNPLHLLLFYKDFNHVVFLDRNLTEKSRPFSLSEFGIDNVELISASARGGVWVLDWLKRELNYFNPDFKLINQSTLPGNIIEINNPPAHMLETDGLLFISFPQNGIFCFDRAGAYHSMFSLINAGRFQKSLNQLIFVEDNHIRLFSTETGEIQNIELPVELILLSARIEGNLLFAFAKKRILFFSLN